MLSYITDDFFYINRLLLEHYGGELKYIAYFIKSDNICS